VTLKTLTSRTFSLRARWRGQASMSCAGPDRQRSGGDCGRIHAAGPAFAGGGVSADFAYVAESHVIDLKKMLDAHDLHEDLHLQAGDLCMCRRAGSRKSAGMFRPTR